MCPWLRIAADGLEQSSVLSPRVTPKISVDGVEEAIGGMFTPTRFLHWREILFPFRRRPMERRKKENKERRARGGNLLTVMIIGGQRTKIPLLSSLVST